jgi:hypothetical protein
MAVHISPQRIQRIKERWESEVLVGLQRSGGWTGCARNSRRAWRGGLAVEAIVSS